MPPLTLPARSVPQPLAPAKRSRVVATRSGDGALALPDEQAWP